MEDETAAAFQAVNRNARRQARRPEDRYDLRPATSANQELKPESI
jgi:hypothetical protein